MAPEAKIEFLSKVVPAMMSSYECRCSDCECRNPASQCDRTYRMISHGSDVSRLLLACPEIVTLTVGPNEVKLTAHKAVLGFTSTFFEAALYSEFKESHSNMVTMPEENPEGVTAYIMWSYSGQIESCCCATELWVLGDRLGSPKFTNEVMYLMYSTYNLQERWLSAQSADIAFKQTVPGSQLRKFVKAYVDAHGPLCTRAVETEVKDYENETYERDWHALIEARGELVLHLTIGNGFRGQSYVLYGEQPYLLEHQSEYLVNVPLKEIDAFIQDKLRAKRRLS